MAIVLLWLEIIFPAKWIPIIKTRQSHDCIIFIMGSLYQSVLHHWHRVNAMKYGQIHLLNLLRTYNIITSKHTGIILYMHPAYQRRHIATSSLIGWAHILNDPRTYACTMGHTICNSLIHWPLWEVAVIYRSVILKPILGIYMCEPVSAAGVIHFIHCLRVSLVWFNHTWYKEV